jgi:hypothetical protein
MQIKRRLLFAAFLCQVFPEFAILVRAAAFMVLRRRGGFEVSFLLFAYNALTRGPCSRVVFLALETCEGDMGSFLRSTIAVPKKSSKTTSSPAVVVLDASTDPFGWIQEQKSDGPSSSSSQPSCSTSPLYSSVPVSATELDDLNQLYTAILRQCRSPSGELLSTAIFVDSLSPLLFRHSPVNVIAFLKRLQRSCASSTSLQAPSQSPSPATISLHSTSFVASPVTPTSYRGLPVVCIFHTDGLSSLPPETAPPDSRCGSSATSTPQTLRLLEHAATTGT